MVVAVNQGFPTPNKTGFSEKLLGSVKSGYLFDVMAALGNHIGEWGELNRTYSISLRHTQI